MSTMVHSYITHKASVRNENITDDFSRIAQELYESKAEDDLPG